MISDFERCPLCHAAYNPQTGEVLAHQVCPGSDKCPRPNEVEPPSDVEWTAAGPGEMIEQDDGLITVDLKFSSATMEKYTKPDIWTGVFARFPRALEEVAKLSTLGCHKHNVALGDLSYLDVPNADVVYKDAIGRHILQQAQHGPVNRADFDMLHAVHIAWNALANLEVELRALAPEGPAEGADSVVHDGATK